MKTYKIEMKDNGEWVQNGCWGGENCVEMSLEEAERDLAIIEAGYPEATFRIEEEI